MQPGEENESGDRKKRRFLLFWTTLSVFLITALILTWYLIWGQFEVSTSDSYVHGNLVQLNSQIPGIVTEIHAEETQFVKKGQIIIELDRTDPLISFDQSKALLGETVREVLKLYQNVESLASELQVKKAELIRASWDYTNRLPLVEPGAISKQEFEHTTTTLETAKNSLEKTKHDLYAAYALVQNTNVKTHPKVLEAAERVKNAYVNLRRCHIRAPTDGIIAMRNVQVGESIDQTTPLLAIVPLSELWVDANFKEVHLKNVRLGQPVLLEADFYGHRVKYHGNVTGLSAGTGSAFSVLPPQNATGNWIKIVQRLPVRVDLNPEELIKHPLMVGLSMHTKIDTHDRSGDRIAQSKAKLTSIYSTDIYPMQEEGADYVISKIIKENSSGLLRDSIAHLDLKEVFKK
ncbi:MAG: HlyD family efflux transporter periplasmic adaptor subunit [Simkaniaceae bacterium]